MLRKFAEAGRVARKRCQHVVCKGTLLRYDLWTWQFGGDHPLFHEKLCRMYISKPPLRIASHQAEEIKT